jgi:hypothetical protein
MKGDRTMAYLRLLRILLGVVVILVLLRLLFHRGAQRRFEMSRRAGRDHPSDRKYVQSSVVGDGSPVACTGEQ